jgi:hypothetical protein
LSISPVFFVFIPVDCCLLSPPHLPRSPSSQIAVIVTSSPAPASRVKLSISAACCPVPMYGQALRSSFPKAIYQRCPASATTRSALHSNVQTRPKYRLQSVATGLHPEDLVHGGMGKKTWCGQIESVGARLCPQVVLFISQMHMTR